MHTIYSLATKTVVFLGPARDAHLAIQLLRELCFEAEMNLLFIILRRYKHERRLKRFRALQKLIRNPWIERVWIVQEVAMSLNIEVYYATQRIAWDDLVDIMTTGAEEGLIPPSALFALFFLFSGSRRQLTGLARRCKGTPHLAIGVL